MRDLSQFDFSSIPTLEELEEMSPDDLDDLLGLSPSYDIPPAARRAMTGVGIVDADEGGFPHGSLARQSPALIRAILGRSRRTGCIALGAYSASPRSCEPNGST